MGKLATVYEMHLTDAYHYYYNHSKTEAMYISTMACCPGDGFYEMQQEAFEQLKFLENSGYIEKLTIDEKFYSFRITQKGLDYFDAPTSSIQNITTITQGNQSNAVIGNENTIHTNISHDVFIDIQVSDFDDEHKVLLTKLFAEINKSTNEVTTTSKIKDFVYNITTGAVTDSAKAALVFAMSKLFGL